MVISFESAYDSELGYYNVSCYVEDLNDESLVSDCVDYIVSAFDSDYGCCLGISYLDGNYYGCSAEFSCERGEVALLKQRIMHTYFEFKLKRKNVSRKNVSRETY